MNPAHVVPNGPSRSKPGRGFVALGRPGLSRKEGPAPFLLSLPSTPGQHGDPPAARGGGAGRQGVRRRKAVRNPVAGSRGLALTLGALILTAPVRAGDWPQFRGPGGP